ncbi:MAG: hypothetical protein VKJ27_05265 [Synechocystis sp.]|nr:hypothetical protein [Synechocystis sp.]
MNQLIISDLDCYQDTNSKIQGSGLTPIKVEGIQVSIVAGVESLVVTQFPDYAGTAYIAGAAISAGQGNSESLISFIDLNIYGPIF